VEENSDVKASMPKGLGLGLTSVFLLTWPRKYANPMQNNIGCIHYVVLLLRFSLQFRCYTGELTRLWV